MTQVMLKLNISISSTKHDNLNGSSKEQVPSSVLSFARIYYSGSTSDGEIVSMALQTKIYNEILQKNKTFEFFSYNPDILLQEALQSALL